MTHFHAWIIFGFHAWVMFDQIRMFLILINIDFFTCCFLQLPPFKHEDGISYWVIDNVVLKKMFMS